MLRDQRVMDGTSTDQVFLDDPLEERRIALSVPRAFWIDDRDRPAFADAEAVRLGAQDPALLGETQFLQPRLQVIPRGETALLLAALGLRLIAAEKDVPLRHRHANRAGHGALFVEDH